MKGKKMSKEIVAPMPGAIVKLDVKKGQAVAEGETLLFLEAMKMENPIVTPVAGTVADILVNVGDQVATHQLLAMIE